MGRVTSKVNSILASSRHTCNTCTVGLALLRLALRSQPPNCAKTGILLYLLAVHKASTRPTARTSVSKTPRKPKAAVTASPALILWASTLL